MSTALAWILWVAGACVGLAGLLLFALALLRDRARGRRRCPRCWYDMAGVPGLTCPECGRTGRNQRSMQRTRRSWRRALLAVLVILIGCGLAISPRVARKGALAVVPTSLLVAAMWIDDTTDCRLLEELDSRGRDEVCSMLRPTRWMLARALGPLLNDTTHTWRPAGLSTPPVGTPSGTSVRNVSLYWLEEMPKSARWAEPELAWAILHESDPVRRTRVIRLAARGRTALSAQQRWLDGPPSATRTTVVESLGLYGPMAGDCAARLGAITREPGAARDIDPAIYALGYIGNARAADELARFLTDSQPRRAAALEGLSRCERGAAAHYTRDMVSLLEADDTESQRLRSLAVAVLDGIGPEAGDSLDALTRANASDADWRVRHNALSALASIGAPADTLIPACRRALGERDPTTRLLALQIIGRRPELAPSLSTEIRKALDDPQPEVAEAAKGLIDAIDLGD